MDFRETRFWREALADRPDDPHGRSREKLRAAFEGFRDRAASLAAEIPRNLADYTVHDITHLDALWGIAQTIAGDDVSLSPAEAFVLGGAFLCHDLGMSASAYVGGLTDVEASPLWLDGAKVLGLDGTSLAPEERERLIGWVLRENHAAQGAKLPTQGWADTRTGELLYLIDNSDLRRAFGPLIGRLATSHWWSFDRVIEEFRPETTAVLDFPESWRIDELKLAALLRLADAAHIDSRRAPTFLRVIRHVHGYSELHWIFQEIISKPSLRVDRLLYTSLTAIEATDANAWWIAFDTINMIDQELSRVDAYLSTQALGVRFAARGVVGANNAIAFSRTVPTDGWLPIDARPQISAVSALIEKLGGRELYGDDPTVAIRELIQNGSDAVRAMTAIRGAKVEADHVEVVLSDEDMTLEVSDTGIGMSLETIRDVLLDFGSSGWRLDIIRRDLPDLLRTKFQASGKYGIGFFSVFMLGEKVTLTTRRYDAAVQDTLVLEFTNGLWERPLLRKAAPTERKLSAGTSVRVQLEAGALKAIVNFARDDSKYKGREIEKLVQTLAPGSTVPIDVRRNADVERVISGAPIQDVPEDELLERATLPSWRWHTEEGRVAKLTDIISDGGEWLGRAAVTAGRPYSGRSRGAIVTVGGIRAARLDHVAGFLLGEPLRAARDAAVPIGKPEPYAVWASQQATLLSALQLDHEAQQDAAETIITLGGDPGKLVVGETAGGYVDLDQFSEWAKHKSEIVILQDAALSNARGDRFASRTVDLAENVIAVSTGYRQILSTDIRRGWVAWPRFRGRWFGTVEGRLAEILAREWNNDLACLEKAALFSTDDEPVSRVVGTIRESNRTIRNQVTVIRRVQAYDSANSGCAGSS